MTANKIILLGVNIDHVATLRQARGTRYPDPVQAALAVEEAGADNITLHLREDRRHIQERDVKLIQQVMLTSLNLEMAVTEEMLQFALHIKPHHCCLVPERREELTTEGGLDVAAQEQRIRDACQRLAQAGIEVSLFIDPDSRQLEAALRCGAAAIEIHTGEYAEAGHAALREEKLSKIQQAAQWAKQAGLIVNAGHGLHYHNVQAIAAIPELMTLNIGHAIIARALFTGLNAAVMQMKQLLTTVAASKEQPKE
jgi:pyridoxine 5-phosphate synthase